MSLPFHFLDPAADLAIWEGRRLPHWSQPGAVCFATWRTWDSIPREVMKRWLDERVAWLRSLGIDPEAADWKAQVRNLPVAVTIAYRTKYAERWNDSLDACHGRCPLRIPECSVIVANSLLHFDNQRYLLFDFAVMPNHVHVLAAFPSVETMKSQFDSWKHFTAVKINRKLHRRGRLWQIENFDHLVRHEDQFQFLRRYIRQNPAKARLKPGEYRLYSKNFPSEIASIDAD